VTLSKKTHHRGRRAGGEMTQTLYANMNKSKKKKPHHITKKQWEWLKALSSNPSTAKTNLKNYRNFFFGCTGL
jgi:hypothetical protein